MSSAGHLHLYFTNACRGTSSSDELCDGEGNVLLNCVSLALGLFDLGVANSSIVPTMSRRFRSDWPTLRGFTRAEFCGISSCRDGTNVVPRRLVLPLGAVIVHGTTKNLYPLLVELSQLEVMTVLAFNRSRA